MAETRGQWIVCLRDIPSGEDEYLGPYHSDEKAQAVADRLNRDIAARGAGGTVDAIVEWVRPGIELEEIRDEMLVGLDDLGYVMT